MEAPIEIVAAGIGSLGAYYAVTSRDWPNFTAWLRSASTSGLLSIAGVGIGGYFAAKYLGMAGRPAVIAGALAGPTVYQAMKFQRNKVL